MYNLYFTNILIVNANINYKILNILYNFYNTINNKPFYLCIFYNNIFLVFYSLSIYLIIKSKLIKRTQKNKIK